MTMKSINLTLPLIMTYPYFPFIRPCINPTHFKLVCCHFWCILFSYSLLHYIVLWFIMINKTLTVYVYIYISYIFFTALYHIPSSSIATSLILRTFPSLQQVEGSSPASLPLSSLDVPRLKRNLGLWNLKSFKGDRWNHRKWSACHFTEIAVPFSPKGWSVPWNLVDSCHVYHVNVSTCQDLWVEIILAPLPLLLHEPTKVDQLTHSADADRHITSEHVR